MGQGDSSTEHFKGDKNMKRYFFPIFVGLLSIAVTLALVETRAVAVNAASSTVVFDSNGRLQLPTGYRRWVFVGAPLTPNGLNNGKAGFPEYHHVYVEEKNLDVYLKTGSFPEGTIIVKELTRVLDPTFSDGSRAEPSGRGYFNGEFNGLDVTVKDSKRFAKTNGWGFFNFGHHPLPYAESAEEAPASECAGCHGAFVAKTDMTWVQFYPMLRHK
jgi:Cytochrome P460